MFPDMGNRAIISNRTIDAAIAFLGARLPSTWKLRSIPEIEVAKSARADGLLELTSPERSRATLLLEEKRSLSPRQARDLSLTLLAAAKDISADGVLVIAPFLSVQTRERLQSAGIAYVDLTGNAWLSLARPAIYLQTQGARKDPAPRPQPVQSLKGATVARIVRALCDWRPPVGTRELALRAQTSAGYTSRVLQFLEAEDLVERSSKGEVEEANWRGLIVRWAQDYSVTRTNTTQSLLAPRGIASLMRAIPDFEGRIAVTGSLAATEAALISGTRLAMCYVDDAQRAAVALGLQPTEGGANVVLLEPFDEVVFARTRDDGGLRKVAYSQCAVDLLTGPGRDPNVGEALMGWMQANEDIWRA